MSGLSILEIFSTESSHKCGYCKKSKSSINNGMWAHVLDPLDYRDLMDRGWRRSGNYLYKPVLKTTCCPQYSIRLSVSDFILSKSHKRILKHFIGYLREGHHRRQSMSSSRQIEYYSHHMNDEKEEENESSSSSEDEKEDDEEERGNKKHLMQDVVIDKKELDKRNVIEKQIVSIISNSKVSNSDKSKKKKNIRRQRRQNKIDAGKPVRPPKNKNKVKTLKDFTEEILNLTHSKHQFTTRFLFANRKNFDFENSFEESFVLYKKYQVIVHGDKASKVTRDRFTNFLCNSSLSNEDLGYGAFHQQYLIDGRIICVGVLDILPASVSSVYLYYDPLYSFLSLGTLSSLLEIGNMLDGKLRSRDSTLNYYYMGFYIHSCSKMRYKAQYFPSHLLCPETLIWIPFEDCVAHLNSSKYSRFNSDSEAVDNEGSIETLDSIQVIYLGKVISYGDYLRLSHKDSYENDLLHYSKLVGKSLASKMLFIRD